MTRGGLFAQPAPSSLFRDAGEKWPLRAPDLVETPVIRGGLSARPAPCSLFRDAGGSCSRFAFKKVEALE